MRLNIENPVGEGFEQWLPDSEVRPAYDVDSGGGPYFSVDRTQRGELRPNIEPERWQVTLARRILDRLGVSPMELE